MIKDTVKKRAITRVVDLTLNLSDENLVKIINIAEKSFIKDKSILVYTEQIKKAFQEKSPAVKLVRNTLNKLSPQSRKGLIENFFINAMINGRQEQAKLRKKLGFGLPWFFVISPSARCNLNCIGCYAGEYQKHEGLTFEEVDRILTEAKQLGIYFVTISGGEPYFWPPLLKIFQKHHDMYFQTYTNGTLLDKEMAKKLAKLGNVAPAISIEGLEKETDARRGKGVFQKVMQAMDNLKEAGVMFGFSATPTKLNAETLMSDEFIDLMIEKGCSFGWFFQYVPIGRKPDVSLMATPEQRNKLRAKTVEFRTTKPIFIGDFWNDGPYVGGCLAGARPGGYFHINCNGDVEPCVFVQFAVDNIKNKKLIDVIQSPFFKAIQEAQPYCKNKNLLSPCILIDNPWVLREIVKQYKAQPSYNSSYEVISDPKICQFLDKYSEKYKKITDPLWENSLNAKYKDWKERYKSADK
ncbi:MAG: Cyclic pyranopterin monophosphate synthase [Parcubacteria group bacterium ADurb.Bin305]|nr:MAG: Cyclic pyranopterin monophosphate synthase [Parcubacteria group bacterium ADurb.Bin305]